MFNVVLIMFMLFQLIILIITNIDSIQKIVHAFPHTPKQFYPVLIGYDGERILPQLVNSAFEEVRSNFAVCYNVKYAFLHDENIIAYKFSIRRKVDSLSDEVLQELIQAQVVKILTETMQFFDCYIAAEPLTVIELRKMNFWLDSPELRKESKK